MADWTFIPDSSVDPDAPLTSDLAYAWRDNPIAIAEGSVGAPRIVDIALNAGAITGNGIAFVVDRLVAHAPDGIGMYAFGVKTVAGQTNLGTVVPGSQINIGASGIPTAPGTWRSAGYNPGDGIFYSLWQRIA